MDGKIEAVDHARVSPAVRAGLVEYYHGHAEVLDPAQTISADSFFLPKVLNTSSYACAKRMVARDGIEPPPPALSGLRSTD